MPKLFKLLLFTGIFPFILSLPRKYYLIKQKKTWSEAQAYCQANHTDLAIIESDKDMLQLQTVAQSHQFTSEAWIGLYNDINSWRWSYQNMSIESFKSWGSGEPNNHNGKEKCALVDDRIWLDKPCDELHEVICFDDNETTASNPYKKVLTKMTWYAAQIYCRQHYTDLASARDNNENEALHQLLGSDKFWFGLFRDSWKWVDHTEMSGIMWKNGQPDNKAKNENCAFLKDSKAEDKSCTNQMHFFCYSVITGQKQTIRLKVQAEQDGNDPEIQAAILKKIEDKLQELGIAENATVTWGKQPDGKVFNKKKNPNKK